MPFTSNPRENGGAPSTGKFKGDFSFFYYEKIGLLTEFVGDSVVSVTMSYSTLTKLKPLGIAWGKGLLGIFLSGDVPMAKEKSARKT
jgi:hypothetical protein